MLIISQRAWPLGDERLYLVGPNARYNIDKNGVILDAHITPPTAQNQPIIESDLYQFIDKFKSLPDAKLQWQCEQLIRNYDPCISCSCHFLKLHVDRS